MHNRSRRALSLPEVLTMILVFLMLGSFSTAFSQTSQYHSHKQKCRNNLRGVGIGMILYSNDYRFFPHMRKLKEVNSAKDVSRVYRSLIYFKYIDTSEAYICPSSEDFPVDMEMSSPSALDDPKLFSFTDKGNENSSRKKPISKSIKGDVSVFENMFLSYTYRRRKLNGSSVRSSNVITADKALKKDLDEADEEAIVGNHSDGFNIGYADCTVHFARTNLEKEMSLITRRLHMAPFKIED